MFPKKIFNNSQILKIALGKDARNTAACSVDGYRICELKAGDR